MPIVPGRFFAIRHAAWIASVLLSTAVACIAPVAATPQSSDFSARSVPILVSDFELYSVPPPLNLPRTPATQPNQQKPNTPPAADDAELAAVQARRLMDFFATTMVETLQKNGYTGRRTKGATLPKGALLRGVFAEPDEKNRIRRTLLGGASVNARFFLYVGIFNLARPDQPLYQLAAEQPGGSQYGPVITLNNYVPLAKYELNKNPTEEDVRKICAQIAASLTAVLAANPNAFAQ
jgi:uncharacterized protein DUF4410